MEQTNYRHPLAAHHPPQAMTPPTFPDPLPYSPRPRLGVLALDGLALVAGLALVGFVVWNILHHP